MIRARFLACLVAIALAVGLAVGLAHANMAPPLEEFRLGLSVEKTRYGARIIDVEGNSVAEKAGLKKGDLILAVDRRYAKKLSAADLKALTDDAHVWPVSLIIVRNGEEILDFRLQS
jgi:predicted metalloprotease with PDZ domain